MSWLAVIDPDMDVSGNLAQPALDGDRALVEDGMISDVGEQTAGFASTTCSSRGFGVPCGR